IRPILTDTLLQVAAAQPQAVALDVLLADKSDGTEDAHLEAALRGTPNLILPCDLVGGAWEDPLPLFASTAAAVGHVHPEVDRYDGVSREVSLEETVNHQRRWALALEAFRISRGQPITESPADVSVGNRIVPAARADAGRPLLIRYRPSGVPTVSALHIAENASLLRGKTVFLGVTALSAARDRLLNPYGQNVPGVEVHAHAFETLARGDFLQHSGDLAPLGLSLLFATTAGLTFALLSGYTAYAVAALIVLASLAAPILLFRQGFVFPLFGPAAVAWLSTAGAATYQHFFVRRQLRRSESEKSRYQQAIHWAAHEMRTPLTAIQGSSEIMTNYSLPQAKQKQLSEMINSESKRLARLIQTFLDVERLAEGQMDLKREVFEASGVIDTCLRRAEPLAQRKRITLSLDTPVEGTLTGDRELMEYALYNLLTNAIKYSPGDTHVSVFAQRNGQELRVSVRDQGIGMDSKEIKNIFKKFYRTQRAEQSGEVGTGIGLSIVEEIMTHHGGRMEVTSEPGKGSCFTMVLKTAIARSSVAETSNRRG
ncbi:MAG: CHASE2 and HATPase_c domain-containing protein, partial [Acidobacteriota bacterium]|nr:CHASE2 and HATPase_c domain-containing protein [Acidobacteriota bacterium]